MYLDYSELVQFSSLWLVVHCSLGVFLLFKRPPHCTHGHTELTNNSISQHTQSGQLAFPNFQGKTSDFYLIKKG